MRPDFHHPDFDALASVWRKMRDVLAGQRAVKSAHTLYLPMLDSQNGAQYDAYKARADFYPATQRTILGLLGMIFRKPTSYVVPDVLAKQVDEHRRDITLAGVSLESFSFHTVGEMLSVGRGYVVVSYHAASNRPYWRLLKAENVINWRTQRNPITGDVEFTMIVYRDTDLKLDGDDPFEQEYEEVIKTMRLIPNADLPSLDYPMGFCIAETFRKRKVGDNRENPGGGVRDEWVRDEPAEVLLRTGRPVPFVPVIGFNAYDLDPSIKAPPLEALADLNLSHYRTSADLEHGAHYCAMPTPWVTGYQAKDSLYIGASSAWTIANDAARVGMLEFTGQGLGALEKRWEAKQQLMATVGARMLESRTRAAETAEALRLRQGESSSALEQIAATASDVLSYALWLHCWWISTTEPKDDAVTLNVNRDFVDATLSGADLRELVAAWQEGAYSWETLFYNLSKGNVLPPNLSVDDERARVEVEIADRSAVAMEIAGAQAATRPDPDDNETQGNEGG